MGVRILNGDDEACMYCSVVMKAFGPVIESDDYHTADERVESFIQYLTKNYGIDPRKMDDKELDTAYGDWLKQEKEQWKEIEPD